MNAVGRVHCGWCLSRCTAFHRNIPSAALSSRVGPRVHQPSSSRLLSFSSSTRSQPFCRSSFIKSIRQSRLFSISTSPAPSSPPSYHFASIEKKWQQRWAEQAEEEISDDKHNEKPPFYSLSMFPYPSGALHMGHVRVYTISDTLARFHRQRGFRTVHPMGWDAFGLPAENAALLHSIHPAEWTEKNIQSMRKQLNSLSLSFDWQRSVTTCSPDYYRHTQQLFLWLYEAGLVYRKDAFVNWDPVDQTVLANEQVDAQGRSWRSGAQVERRKLQQWWIAIGAYREQLLSGLDSLPGWPAQVKQMQRNWIGKSEGHTVTFSVCCPSHSSASLTVFTTRLDTIYGVTYLAIAPEHALIDRALNEGWVGEQKAEVEEYRRKVGGMTDVQRRSNDSQEGVWSGLYALHPLTHNKLKVMISEYVLPDYGTGAVMGVPAHDARDHALATRYSLPIIPVVAPPSPLPDDVYPGDGVLINSGPFNGQQNVSAIPAILAALGSSASPSTDYRLKDWLVSRQRYWGTPIPIIHCPSCGVVPVPSSSLPIELPWLDFSSIKRGNPLASDDAKSWRQCSCPKCGGKAERETDTLDTFVDSSWYFLRYLSPSSPLPFDPDEVAPFMPVHCYVGGIEHAILHLLYSRFFTHFLHSRGLLPSPEPFRSLVTQGMVQGQTFKHPKTGRFIPPSEVLREGGEAYVEEGGERVKLDIVWEKMSKSKQNGVEPASVIERYGADTVRLFMLFKAPPEKSLNWDEEAIQGQVRWLNRLQSLLQMHLSTPSLHSPSPSSLPPHLQALRTAIQSTVREVTTLLTVCSFNVAVAHLHKLTNTLYDCARQYPTQSLGTGVVREGLQAMARMLAPMAPHFASEMWEMMGEKGRVEDGWPKVLGEDKGEGIGLVVMVGGKRICVVHGMDEEELEDQVKVERVVRGREDVMVALQGKKEKRVVLSFKKEKGSAILNFVV